MALEKMGLTLVEIINEINMAQVNTSCINLSPVHVNPNKLHDIPPLQVFLWLQEKSLFGQGSLLHNPSPGVDFSGADLIRNLILVSVMDQSLSYQAQFYR